MPFNRADPKSYTKRYPNQIDRRRLDPVPVSDRMATIIGAIRESGLTSSAIADEVRRQGNGASIAAITIDKWMGEKVFSPRIVGAAAVMAAIGYDLAWVKRGTH